MNNLKLQKQIRKTFKKYKYSPKSIEGQLVPENVKPFYAYDLFAGRDVMLYSYRPLENDGKISENNKYNNKLRQIQSCFDNEVKKKAEELGEQPEGSKLDEIIEKYKEKIQIEYLNTINEELDNGVIRIPYEYEVFEKTALVKSKYFDDKINYSPKILKIHKFKTISAEQLSSYFTDAYTKPLCCYIATVYIGRKIEKDDILYIYDMVEEVFAIINDFRIEEFKKKKNSKKYQHRQDFDPDFL